MEDKKKLLQAWIDRLKVITDEKESLEECIKNLRAEIAQEEV